MSALVAITATTKLDGLSRVRLNEAYVTALVAAGVTPLLVPPASLDPDAVLSRVDGLVLSGGEDVAPEEYGQDPSSHTQPPHAGRDRIELALARRARELRIPTLAICRGIQVVNVAFGGTLIQDIPTEVGGALQHDLSEQRTRRVHDVTVDADSALARVLGATTLAVNSSHHQAIARPADGLRVVAHAPDGVIEGAEWTADDWWMLAVQWHPEELVGTPEPWDRKLFDAFARATATHSLQATSR